MLARGVNEEKIMNFLTLMNIDHKTGCQCCRATIMPAQWAQIYSKGALLFVIMCIFTRFKIQVSIVRAVVEKLKYDPDHSAKS